MKYEQYKEKFTLYADSIDLSSEKKELYLIYAKKLIYNGLPVIYDQQHFCELTGIDASYIYRACNDAKKFYRKFVIKKGNGKKRIIYEPLPTLKKVQYYILNDIFMKLETNIYSKAYKKGSSIKDNAKFHRGQKYVLNMDIKDYFGSITDYKVYNKLQDVGYNKEVAMIITKLCTLNGTLPQGAPTSPQLSNVLTYDLDVKLSEISLLYKIRYTRYADDITFSGDFDIKKIKNKIKDILYQEGFKINKDKTRVATKANRQVVTGIVVNRKNQVNKNKRKEIRKNIYYIKKYGIESHLEYLKIKKTPKDYLRSLAGQIGYVCFINPKDKEMKEYKELVKSIITKM